jgi:FkbM family methyltransferase
MGIGLLRQQELDRLVAYEEGAKNAPDMLALLVRDELARRGACRFVQVGANDGQRDDSLREHIQAYRLPGLMIEPNPAPFARLVEAYRDRPDIRPINAAVGPGGRMTTLFAFDRPEEKGIRLDLLSSLDRSILEQVKRNDQLSADIVAIEVPQRPLMELVVEHGFTDAALLLVDTEGFDYEVLKLVDVGIFSPRIIQLEHIYLDGAARTGAVRWFAERGYRTVFSGSELFGLRV